ncbi:hypothetical protein NFI96_005716 [Prochilodus magdalenae]|nr:hypothetical protein NFI96_005716 [Prochilodus magdalenae]
MYILLFNLPLNDMLGASTLFPQLVSSILAQSRSISYSACFVQALATHLYGAGAFLILSAMAYDRYVAICCPLKYNTLMSPNNLLKMISIMWTLHFVLIGLLLALNYRKEICSTKIVDIFCNNPSLMKLLCGDITTSNSYGLFIMTFYDGLALLIVAFTYIQILITVVVKRQSDAKSLSLLIVVFTYIQILITVVVKRQSDAKSKALQTCGTHLIVFLCYEFCAYFTLVAHRIEGASPSLRRGSGTSVMIFPPIVNPLIYGLKMKEIRQNLFFLFHEKVSLTKQKTRLRGAKRKR